MQKSLNYSRLFRCFIVFKIIVISYCIHYFFINYELVKSRPNANNLGKINWTYCCMKKIHCWAANYCEAERKDRVIDMKSFLVDDEKKLIYCYNHKVASSFLINLFAKVSLFLKILLDYDSKYYRKKSQWEQISFKEIYVFPSIFALWFETTLYSWN